MLSQTYGLRGHGQRIDRLATFNNTIVSADSSGSITIWDLTKRRPFQVWKAHSDAILTLVQIDETHLLTHSRDSNVRIWSITDRRRIESTGMNAIAVSPDSLIEDTKSNLDQQKSPILLNDSKSPEMIFELPVNALNFCNVVQHDKYLITPATTDSEKFDVYQLVGDTVRRLVKGYSVFEEEKKIKELNEKIEKQTEQMNKEEYKREMNKKEYEREMNKRETKRDLNQEVNRDINRDMSTNYQSEDKQNKTEQTNGVSQRPSTAPSGLSKLLNSGCEKKVDNRSNEDGDGDDPNKNEENSDLSRNHGIIMNMELIDSNLLAIGFESGHLAVLQISWDTDSGGNSLEIKPIYASNAHIPNPVTSLTHFGTTVVSGSSNRALFIHDLKHDAVEVRVKRGGVGGLLAMKEDLVVGHWKGGAEIVEWKEIQRIIREHEIGVPQEMINEEMSETNTIHKATSVSMALRNLPTLETVQTVVHGEESTNKAAKFTSMAYLQGDGEVVGYKARMRARKGCLFVGFSDGMIWAYEKKRG